MKSVFKDLGNKYNTDKITRHGYDRFYPDYIKRDIKKILEIGIENYKSVSLWLDYCPNVFVYGLDITTQLDKERVKVIKGDQSNYNDLENLITITGDNIDVILDDGSHYPPDQLFSFIKLFPFIIEGGIYIIEDIETSYWKHNLLLYNNNINEGIDSSTNIINIFLNVLHLINREFIHIEDINKVINNCIIPLSIIDSISTITFAQNCIIIKKKLQDEYKYNNRPYRNAN